MPLVSRDIVVVGASAGGLPALRQLLGAFPGDLAASVFIVSHLSPDAPSLLPEILSKSGPLPVASPEDGTPIEPGRVYVAQPNRHLLIERGVVRVVRGPRENRHRPSVDALFRSAAWAYGPRVAGVVLSGYLDDGSAGLWAIKSCGGLAIVQDPADAIQPQMPQHAAMDIDVDYLLPVAEIGPLLVDLVRQPVEVAEIFHRPQGIKEEIEFAKMERDITDIGSLGKLSPFTCPACRGALWELQNDDILRYRCHTGHAFSKESLLAEQSVGIEDALFAALRAVEEKATALRRLGQRHEGRSTTLTGHFESRAHELDRTAEVLRALLSGLAA
jgi:two-component system chemotaxis response regulator CheB